jgi:hypothetical protein
MKPTTKEARAAVAAYLAEYPRAGDEEEIDRDGDSSPTFGHLRALLAADAGPGWRSMDDAPRDGTRVLLFSPTKAFPGAVIVGWYGASGKAWFSEPGMWQRAPVAWMPLPAAPAPDAKEEG